VTHLSASDSFSTMALYKSIYLFYLLKTAKINMFIIISVKYMPQHI